MYVKHANIAYVDMQIAAITHSRLMPPGKKRKIHSKLSAKVQKSFILLQGLGPFSLSHSLSLSLFLSLSLPLPLPLSPPLPLSVPALYYIS